MDCSIFVCCSLSLGSKQTVPQQVRYWSVAATHSGQEERAASNIERQDFEYWLPRVARLLANGRECRSLMFPGWIFLKIDARQSWQRLSNTRGVRRVVMCDGMPVRVRDSDVRYLRGLERTDGLVHLTPRFSAGDQVAVVSGAYDGVSGKIKSIVNCGSATQRVRVLMQMLGRSVVKDFDERQLALA